MHSELISKNHSLQKRPTQLYFALAAVFLALSLLLITPRFCFAAQASDWMSDIDNTVPISHLTVPGTHDAAAYNPSGKVDASFAKCQDKNIQAQLEAGVRSFDLRYVYNSSNGEFELWHGYNIDYIGGFKCMDDTGTTQLTLKSVLTTIQNYLAAHPTEFVFVDLQKEGGDTMDTELSNLKKSFNIVENSGYSASTPINNVRGKILDGSTFLQNASGIYNTWECTVEEKINDLQEVFTNAPAITLGYAGTIEQKCVYTNISWQMSNFSKTPADYADGVRSGFLNSNPFSTYGQKAYGVVLYDFPSESTLSYTIQANNWAKAQRTVQFNTMGGSLINPVTITSGSTISQPTNPTREGYTFNGWYKDENLSQIWNFETDTVDNNTTLYAKWSVNTYSITYNLNGGTNAASNPETYTYGTGVGSFESPTHEGYTFEGWFSDGAFTTQVTNIPATQTGDVALYAKWAKNADPEPETQPDPEPEPEPQPDPDPEPDPSPEPEPDPQPEPEQQVKATTLKGTEAPETAEQIAYEAFPNGCSTVIVCTTASFKDAMSATGLAGALDGPLLLTDTQELSSAVANAIDKLNATQAYIIGGKAVISDGAEQSLKAKLGEGKVMRIAGNEAEDTSVECGKKIKEIDTNAGEYAIVAMQDNFQDALSISSFAYKYHAPIFLTTSGNTVDDYKLTSAQVEMLSSGIYANAKIFVPGGPGALPTSNIEGVFDLNKRNNIQRIYGKSGFDTSNQIATWFTSNGYLTGSCVVIANGAKGPGGKDALAGAALAGKNSGVILLSNANSTLEATNTITLEGTDSKNSPAYLTNNAKTITKAYVLGGTTVSPQALITKFDSILSEATSSEQPVI